MEGICLNLDGILGEMPATARWQARIETVRIANKAGDLLLAEKWTAHYFPSSPRQIAALPSCTAGPQDDGIHAYRLTY